MTAGSSAASPNRDDDPREKSGSPDRLSPLRELQLVEQFKAGNTAAIAELLASYERRIYAVCYRMLQDHEVARDLAQDAIVKVLEGLETYDGRSKLSTWVIRVTMNCCLSHLRKQRLRRHESLDTPMGSEGTPRRELLPAGEELSPTDRVQRDQERSALVRALQSLDPAARAMLVLRDLQDLDYQQIGEVMGIPVGTVKSRLFRAREALRTATELEVDRGE